MFDGIFSRNRHFVGAVTWDAAASFPRAFVEVFRSAENAKGDLLWRSLLQTDAGFPDFGRAYLSNDGAIFAIEGFDSFLTLYHSGGVLHQTKVEEVCSLLADEIDCPPAELEMSSPHEISEPGKRFSFFFEEGRQRVFAVWLCAANRWLAWELHDGQLLAVSAKLESDLMQAGLALALSVSAMIENGQLTGENGAIVPQFFLEKDDRNAAHERLSACRFLAAHSRPSTEVEAITTDALRARDFVFDFSLNDNQIEIEAYSETRLLADFVLSSLAGFIDASSMPNNIWPSAWPHFYTASIAGVVQLPHRPKPTDGTLVICVESRTEPHLQIRLEVNLSNSLGLFLQAVRNRASDCYTPLSSKSLVSCRAANLPEILAEGSPVLGDIAVAFRIFGLSPGFYFLAASWASSLLEISAKNARFQSPLTGPIKIKGGQDIEGLLLDCRESTGRSAKMTQTKSESGIVKPPIVAGEWLRNQGQNGLRLQRVTYGMNHQCGRDFEATAQEELSIWVSAPPSYDSIIQAQMQDRSGGKVGPARDLLAHTFFGKAARLPVAFYPRHDETLHIRLSKIRFQDRAEAAFATFTFPNLAPRIDRVSGGGQINQSAKIDDLEVLLTDPNPEKHPSIIIKRNGVLASDWECGGRPDFEDATGNRGASMKEFPRDERTLKASFKLFRTPQAQFAQDEIAETQEVTVPQPAEFRRLDDKIILQGVVFKIVAICGAGEIHFAHGYPDQGIPTIDAEVPPFKPDNFTIPGWENFPRPWIYRKADTAYQGFFQTLDPMWSLHSPYTIVCRGPHVAVEITGETPWHRIYLERLQVDNPKDMGWPEKMPYLITTRRRHIPLQNRQSGERIRLRLSIQIARLVEFLVPNPLFDNNLYV